MLRPGGKILVLTPPDQQTQPPQPCNEAAQAQPGSKPAASQNPNNYSEGGRPQLVTLSDCGQHMGRSEYGGPMPLPRILSAGPGQREEAGQSGLLVTMWDAYQLVSVL